jgi:hypothetical protein
MPVVQKNVLSVLTGAWPEQVWGEYVLLQCARLVEVSIVAQCVRHPRHSALGSDLVSVYASQRLPAPRGCREANHIAPYRGEFVIKDTRHTLALFLHS